MFIAPKFVLLNQKLGGVTPNTNFQRFQPEKNADGVPAWHWSLDGFNLSDPGVLLEYTHGIADPQRLPVWNRANSYTNVRGKVAGTAWVLMKRESQRQLAKNGFHTLTIRSQWGVTTIPDLVIVKTLSQAGLPVVAGGQVKEHTNAPILIELRDRRWLMARSTINRQYNVRIPTPNKPDTETNQYYPETLNNGGLWTWQAMVTDIWSNITARKGDVTLPADIPSNSPSGWRFICANAWEALHTVLEYLGCTTVYDHLTGEISIVKYGDNQPGLAAELKKLNATRLRHDFDPDSVFAAGNMPANIDVCFNRKSKYYGIEKDTPRVDNWEATPVHIESVATGIDGAVGRCSIVGDLPALVDCDGAITNSSILSTRATELVARIAADLPNRLGKIYAGSVNTLTIGSEVSDIIIRDYGDQVGQVTEVLHYPHKDPCGHSANCLNARGGDDENLMPVDFARDTHPVYPRLLQPVQVYDTSKNGGTVVAASDNCNMFKGRVRRCCVNGLEVLEDCWIKVLDCYDTLEGNVTIYNHEIFLGRLSGTADCADCEMPLYLVKLGVRPILVVAQECTSPPGGSTTAKVAEFVGGAWTASDTVVEVYDSCRSVFMMPGECHWAWYDCASGRVEFLGEFGLRRRAITESEISCNSEGNLVWIIGDSEATIATCDGEPNCQISACYTHGSTHKLPDGHKFWVQWHKSARNWFIEPEPRNKRWLMNLTEDMCDSGTFGVNELNAGYLDHCTTEDPPRFAENVFNQRADSGDAVMVEWDEGNDRWIITNVTHKKLCNVVDVYVDDPDDPNCLLKAEVPVAEQFCRSEIPSQGCQIIAFDDCDDGTTPSCDTSYVHDEDCCEEN